MPYDEGDQKGLRRSRWYSESGVLRGHLARDTQSLIPMVSLDYASRYAKPGRAVGNGRGRAATPCGVHRNGCGREQCDHLEVYRLWK